MLNKIDYLSSSKLLGQACIGALIGALFALLIAGLSLKVGGRPLQMPDELLSWNLGNVLLKPREKGFYLLALLLGTTGAYLSTARLWLLPSKVLWFFLITSIPIVNFLAEHILQINNHFAYLFMAIILAMSFVFFASRKAQQIIPTTVSLPDDYFNWKLYIALLFIISIILIPSSFTEVASHIGMEFHVASSLIGPALYFLNHHLLPGIDYYTQYSIGEPWLFSYFLANSAEQTMTNYVIFSVSITWVFFAQLLYLLRWLYRSWLPAIIVTFLFLIILFHGDRHFFDPSSSVLRYPLLGVCAWLLARFIAFPRSVISHLSLAMAIALAIFLNTETGIIISFAITLTVLFQKETKSMLLPLFSLGAASLFFLLLLVFLVFGLDAFRMDFLSHIIRPLIIFGKYGFGGWPISWSMSELNWFYNLVTPGIVLATLALIIRSRNANTDRPRLAVLAFFAIVGLLMMAKFINMAIVGLWQMNSLGFFIVLGWWCKSIAWNYKSIYLRLPSYSFSIRGNALAWAIFLLIACYLGSFGDDSRNPTMIVGFRSWLDYPSLATALFYKRPGCNNFDCVANRPAAKDIALIVERTKPGEQVAIIDLYDWTYLVAAHRPPLMLFVPSVTIFTKYQLIESLKRLQSTAYLFLPKGDNKELAINPNDLRNGISPRFHDDYVYDGEGEQLAAWKRKNLVVKPS